MPLYDNRVVFYLDLNYNNLAEIYINQQQTQLMIIPYNS